MYTLNECQEIIGLLLKNIKFPQVPSQLYEPIKYSLASKGKLIRPSLTLMACNLFSSSIHPALNPALAIELFHNFTLLHDDIMDKSEVRRNKPTIHKKWNENTAILSGDAMMIKSYEFIARSPHEKSHKILEVFTNTALKVCEGQQFDMDFERRTDVSVVEYVKMIELKTAALIAASLKIGAICGGAKDEEAEKLYDFGRSLGIAFQLQDDFLDIYGDSKIFGKANGGDIVANKKTFLLINALNIASGNTLEKLTGWLSKEVFNRHEKICEVTKLYDQLGIKELTLTKIKQYFSEALESLYDILVPDAKKEVLREFAMKLMVRSK